MAKEPTRGDSQGYFKDFFLANPTAVLSLLYLYVTAIGMLYSAVLYGRFGINVFDYSEIGDFLLAAFKNPVAFLSGGLLAAVGAALLNYRASAMRRRMRAVESRLQAEIQEGLDHGRYWLNGRRNRMNRRSKGIWNTSVSGR